MTSPYLCKRLRSLAEATWDIKFGHYRYTFNGELNAFVESFPQLRAEVEDIPAAFLLRCAEQAYADELPPHRAVILAVHSWRKELSEAQTSAHRHGGH